jgi:hypothetical protein
MAGPGKKKCDEALALALASGYSVEASARQAHCSERTAYRRLADPGFRARVLEVREELLDRTVAGLTGIGLKCVDTIKDLMQGKAVSDGTKLGAARAGLEFLFRGRELLVLERRVAELEATLKGAT